jgi:multicomponent Na+:H+ antiporter subunit E
LTGPPRGHHFGVRRLIALALWCYLVWVVLTWTLTAEQLAFGAAIAVAVAAGLAPTGEVVAPWTLMRPGRLLGAVRFVAECAARIVVANCKLAYRIWHPRRPMASGMVVTPTRVRSDGALAVVGLATSLIVENQIVDLDRERSKLLYHAVEVPDDGEPAAYADINGPVERLLGPFGEPDV